MASEPAEDDGTSFIDAKGRRWRIQISAGTVWRVRQLLEADLMNLTAVEVCLATGPSAALLACAILRPAPDAAGVSVEDFYEAFGGRAYAEASIAILKALGKWLARGHPDDDAFGKHVAAVHKELALCIDLTLGGGLVAGMDDTRAGDELRLRYVDLVCTLRMAEDAAEASLILDDLGTVERQILGRRQARRRSAWLKQLSTSS